MTGLSCIFDFSLAKDALGFGINSMILNTALIGIQTFKYIKTMQTVSKTYEAVG